MSKAVLLMIAAGVGIGFLLPAGQPAGPVTVAEARNNELRETLLERSELGHFYANAEVGGQLVRFLVDTGATSVALTVEDARRLNIPFSEAEFEVIGEGAGGPVRGKAITLDSVTLDGKQARSVDAVIIEGSKMSLLGQAYLGRFTVEMRGSTMRIS